MGAFAFIRENLRFLSAGVLLTLNSSFGQTFFISIFAAQIMAEFALSAGDWGLLYTTGTTISAFVMFWAGALTDHFRARTLAWLVMPGLALTCVAMSLNQSVMGLLLVVFFLRFLGQGMIFQLSVVSMARWFAGRRGLALSVSALGFWVGQAAIPVAFATLLLSWDWRILWTISAGFVLLCLPVVIWLLTLERTPQSLAEESQSVGMQGRHWTRREVVSSRFFWLLVPLLLGPPSWGTALFFQQVHIAEVKGWPLVDYLALIPVMTLISVGTTLVTGELIDRIGSGRLLQAFPVTWIAGFLLLALSETIGIALVAFVIFGIATGMQASLITAFWAEYFGTRHIGAIKATSASIMVFGSAIGPGISGVLIDLGYTFPEQMVAICIYFAVALVFTWFAVEAANRKLTP
ncbi:MAG: MFS transporter [Pseudomonadota bacterium]